MSTWIFLRGLTRDKRHWGDFPSVFTSHVANADAVCLDLAGNGELHRMKSATHIEDMLVQCRQDLAASGYRPPYHLLALSMGAMVAVAWADRHPEEVCACVLMSTSLRGFNPFYHRLRISAWPDMFRILSAGGAGGNPRLQERLVFRLTCNQPQKEDCCVGRWVRYRQESPVTSSNALRQLLAAVRYRPPRTKPHAPMLLLAGAKDRLVDPACSSRLAAQWQLPVKMHPSAGHDLPLEDGSWVARQIADWLAKERIAGSVDSVSALPCLQSPNGLSGIK